MYFFCVNFVGVFGLLRFFSEAPVWGWTLHALRVRVYFCVGRERGQDLKRPTGE